MQECKNVNRKGFDGRAPVGRTSNGKVPNRTSVNEKGPASNGLNGRNHASTDLTIKKLIGGESSTISFFD